MSVQNPYSDVKIPGKSYFANEAFEPDQSSRPAGEVKERFPGQFPQADGAPARRQPASVANPYGSIYRSSPGGDSKQMFRRDELAEAAPIESSDRTADRSLFDSHPPAQHKNIECIVCYSAHNLSDRLPRKLYCGHTFCQACLRRLDTTLNEQRWIPCPQCRQNTPCPRGGVVMLELDLGIFLALKTEMETARTAVRQDTESQHKVTAKKHHTSQPVTEQPAALCQDTPREPQFLRSPCCARCTGCCCI
ncbi:RING finger protein 224-like [Heptranchias perlo]|uniref:RING finger protein 224-like n=1 Tax=Heptranchias perlo TaxID=212740 RepID=UPI003559C0A1